MTLRLAALTCAALAFPAAAQPLAGLPAPHDTCVLRVDDPGRRVAESELVRLPQHSVERQGAASTFVVTYTGFTAEAEAAFQAAVDIWSDHIESAAPIRVNATFSTLDPGVLGSAGAADLALNRPEFAYANTVYPIALAEAIVGAEFAGVFGSAFDINATFSSAYPNFYFGTDGNTPPGDYDFVTIVLHELGHGLGFAGSAVYDDGAGAAECAGTAGTGCFVNTNLPFVYDRFVEDAAGTGITNGAVYPEASGAFGALITSNQLYNNAPSVTATLGERGRHYAPSTFSRGSSYSHWNEATFPPSTSNALMTYAVALGEAHQDPGANTCAFFGDMGWPLGPACVARIQRERTVAVAGDEGWRMLAAPDADATLGELLGGTHTQGFPGADVGEGPPNVYFYQESLPGDDAQGYRVPTAQDEALPLGLGVFAYLFEDDDQSTPVVDGGFPKALTATGTPATSPFTWSGPGLLSYTDTGSPGDDGWNLLGNPFATALDWDAAARSGLDAAVYVYDDAISGYRTYSAGAGDLPGGVVSPFQAFWVKASAPSPSLTLPPASGTGTFYREGDDARLAVALRLRAAEGSPLGAAQSAAFVVFGTEGADADLDAFDAWSLGSPAPVSVTLASLVGGEALAIDHRPAPDGPVEVDLGIEAAGVEAAALVLTWEAVEAEAQVTLLDVVTGAELDLTEAGTYAFDEAGAAGGAALSLRTGAVVPRFTLRVDPSASTAGEAEPPPASLSAPSPNPARGWASLRLTLPAPERVRAAVYDALGREVAVMLAGDVSGIAELRIDASTLSAGLYVVRVAGERFASAQRLVVIR